MVEKFEFNCVLLEVTYL